MNRPENDEDRDLEPPPEIRAAVEAVGRRRGRIPVLVRRHNLRPRPRPPMNAGRFAMYANLPLVLQPQEDPEDPPDPEPEPEDEELLREMRRRNPPQSRRERDFDNLRRRALAVYVERENRLAAQRQRFRLAAAAAARAARVRRYPQRNRPPVIYEEPEEDDF